MSKLVMGYWDCPVCGNKEIRGDVVNCPSCGRARGDVKFYVKGYTEGESVRSEELKQFEQLDKKKAEEMGDNPDWYCSFCNSLNSDKVQVCGNCGATRADSEANYFEMLKKNQEKEAAELAAQQPSSPKRSSRKPLLIALAVLLVIVGVFVWMNGSKTAGDLKVTALQWTRTINIEENRLYNESTWDSSLPQGAELTGKKKEIHHYEQVLDHYENVEVQRSRQVYDHDEYTLEDNGNGTFRQVSHPVYRTEYYTETQKQPVYRSEPKYQTKYYYNIYRWTPSRDVTASGDSHDTAWPEFTLAENEREGQHSEEYLFTVDSVKKPGSPVTYRVGEETWKSIDVDSQMYITSKRTGAAPFISDEDGNKIADVERVR